MEKTILVSGMCECIYEPRGDHGLEGYQLRDKYRFQKVTPDKKGRIYFRVFPDDVLIPSYYETCSERSFEKYFNVTDIECNQ